MLKTSERIQKKKEEKKTKDQNSTMVAMQKMKMK